MPHASSMWSSVVGRETYRDGYSAAMLSHARVEFHASEAWSKMLVDESGGTDARPCLTIEALMRCSPTFPCLSVSRNAIDSFSATSFQDRTVAGGLSRLDL